MIVHPDCSLVILEQYVSGDVVAGWAVEVCAESVVAVDFGNDACFE